MITTPVERSSRRDWTREHIYEVIRTSIGVTRADLVASTGLPTSTVAHAVSQLLEDGRIVAARTSKGPGTGSGRPARVLQAAPRGRHVAGIDFGHSHIRVALGDDAGFVLDEVAIPIDVDRLADEAIALACKQVELLTRTHCVSLTSVGAGIPGPLDQTTGMVCSPTILSSWVGRRPAKELEARLSVPVKIENDAVLGAYGELRQGAGRDHEHFLYVKASHGVGAGVVLNGQTYHGANGLAGEIGHAVVASHSELCRCGNRGCLEAAIGVDSLLQQIRHSHPLLDPDQLDLTAIGDPITSRILNEAGRTLGDVLASLCNLLNPSALLIGGELGCAGEALIHGVRSSIDRHAQPGIAQSLQILPAALGRRAELIGALHLAGSVAA